MSNTALPAASQARDELFVPDLCRVRAVFLIIIVTELMVLLFALIRASDGWLDWDYLGLASLFAQWCVLTSAAVVCVLRRSLARLPVTLATTAILSIVLINVVLLTLIGQWLLSAGTPGLQVDWHNLGRNLLIATLVTLMLLRNFYLQHQWRLEKQAQLEARVASLQARIQPHFLFNSMNTIASLIAIDPERAEDAVLDLSSLFRASLRNASDRLIPLKEELQLCRQYLDLESLRLGDRLHVNWSLDDEASEQGIPPLTLQPLLENAVYHGIQPLTAGGTIEVKTETRGDWVYVLIRNPMPNETTNLAKGHQMALENIHARISAIYDQTAVLKTSQNQQWFTVTLRLPRQTAEVSL